MTYYIRMDDDAAIVEDVNEIIYYEKEGAYYMYSKDGEVLAIIPRGFAIVGMHDVIEKEAK